MNRQWQAELFNTQYQNYANHKTLIFLHPAELQQQSQMMYRILEQSPGVYFQIQQDIHKLGDFLSSLNQAFHEQGVNGLNDLPYRSKEAAQQLAQQIMSEQGSFTLFIDGYDRVQSEGVDRFISYLGAALESTYKVVIRSREIPSNLLAMVRAQVSEKAVMLPIAAERMLIDYSQNHAEGKQRLEVRAFGVGHAMIEGQRLGQWDGVLPRSLFYFLLDRALCTREDIFDTFWPALAKPEATNVFHVTKRKIHEVIGHDLTVYDSGFYRIGNTLDLNYDAVIFQEGVQQAEVTKDTDERIRLYRVALQLYQGPFLSTIDQPWVLERRAELHQVYVDALLGLAECYERQDKLIEARGLYTRALAQQPGREEIIERVAQAYDRLGQPSHAPSNFQAQRGRGLDRGFKLKSKPQMQAANESL